MEETGSQLRKLKRTQKKDRERNERQHNRNRKRLKKSTINKLLNNKNARWKQKKSLKQ